jgi:hypothetical protein
MTRIARLAVACVAFVEWQIVLVLANFPADTTIEARAALRVAWISLVTELTLKARQTGAPMDTQPRALVTLPTIQAWISRLTWISDCTVHTLVPRSARARVLPVMWCTLAGMLTGKLATGVCTTTGARCPELHSSHATLTRRHLNTHIATDMLHVDILLALLQLFALLGARSVVDCSLGIVI